MANEHFKRTPTSTGNRKVFTWGAWVKIGKLGDSVRLFETGTNNSTDRSILYFSGNKFQYFTEIGNTGKGSLSTDATFRDVSTWYHVIWAFDLTKNSIKIYVNGVDQPLTSTVATANEPIYINATNTHYIGQSLTLSSGYLQGQLSDVFLVDGQVLTPDVFGFYKDGDGYMSSGTSNATDFRPGQWMPHSPTKIKKDINRRGGFGVNGYYLPMNDPSNPGADFHCAPNSIIKLKGEDLPQPQNGAPTTSDAYVSQLRQETGTLGFDGAVKLLRTGGYLDLGTSHSDLVPGSGDFTIECFLYPQGFGNYPVIVDSRTNSGDTLGFFLGFNTNGQLYLYTHSGERNAIILTKGRWYHIALVRQSNVFKLYVDGVKVGTDYTQSQNYTNQIRYIGESPNSESQNWNIDAFISNFRFVKGTAVYTANFTAPTEPLTNVTNTKLLCCNSSTSATAATVAPGTITAVGGAFATTSELTGSISLAVPGISTTTGSNLITNGTFDSNVSNWTATDSTTAWEGGQMKVTRSGGGGLTANQAFTTETGKRYTISGTINSSTSRGDLRVYNGSGTGGSMIINISGTNGAVTDLTGSFTATSTTSTVVITVDNNNGVVYVDNVVVKQEDAPRDYSADIKGSGSNKTLTANGDAGVGYELGGYYGSAMTFKGSGDDAIFVPASSDMELTGDFTIEYWAYSDGNVTYGAQLSSRNYYSGSNNGNFYLGQIHNGSLTLYSYNGTSSGVNVAYTIPTAARYDQWHHMCFEREGNTLRLYLNGVVVAIDTSWTRSLNDAANGLYIGKLSKTGGSDDYGNFDGKLQDFRIYNGVAKYKGGFDVPKPYTPVGIEAFRTTDDTCKNNFATLNPLDSVTDNQSGTDYTQATHSNGNLTVILSDDFSSARGSIGVSTGKYYWEVRLDANTNSPGLGVIAPGNQLTSYSAGGGGASYEPRGDRFRKNGVGHYDGTNNKTANGLIVGVALDKDAGSISFYADGVLQSNGTMTGLNALSDVHIPECFTYNDGPSVDNTYTWNFGQNPSFSGQVTAGTNADDSGKGLFKYAPPTGFLALCEDNLPTPAIADPGKHFKTVLWSGSGSGRGITGVGFKPDLVWVKSRTSTVQHYFVDSVRGEGIALRSDEAFAETSSDNWLRSFDSNGFSIGASGGWNGSGNNYVAWCWKAGGAAVSNNDGSITSQVSANQTAGFSIVSYTGNGTNLATVGHGLNKEVKFMITKSRTTTDNWVVHTDATGTQTYSFLDTTAVLTSDSITAPSSSVFYRGTSNTINGNNLTYISYCWAEIEGYSKFGSYVGNGNADGSFVYCGFKPAWLLVKRSDLGFSSYNWWIIDSSRSPVNGSNLSVYANLSNTESSIEGWDFLSNGFKLRTTAANRNGSGTFIFMAFAESPFQTANAK